MKRSKFSLSHYKLFSCDMGELIPCGLFEVIPGDTVQMATNALVRASPLLSPVMHPVHVRIHHWYVPYRLIWDDFEDFITGGPDGMDASVYPVRPAPTATLGGLADYMGCPTGVVLPDVGVLPWRAYAMIFNEWYRDQDLTTPLNFLTTSGIDNTTPFNTLQNVAWEKDYFTSSRPWEQKGPSITIPIGTTAPVTGIGYQDGIFPGGFQSTTVRYTDGSAGVPSQNVNNPAAASNVGHLRAQEDPSNLGFPNIRADLTNASSVTINSLREALALQRFEEARARYGSRYTEYLRYLGVRSSDARLQRPEYLGGGKQTIQFSEVLQTAEGTSPVGELRGHGIGALRSNRFRRFFEEHGIVMSLMSVRPRTMYMQGLHRMFNRRTKEDFWQQELQHIGQQEVLNKEVYAVGGTPEGVFGYQDRYDEYRRMESSVAGEFRTTLNFWHFAREFGAPPALNDTFVKSVPTDRTFAVPSEDVLYIMANHSIQARRMVAATGTSFIF